MDHHRQQQTSRHQIQSGKNQAQDARVYRTLPTLIDVSETEEQ